MKLSMNFIRGHFHISHLELHVLWHEGAEAHEGKDEEEVGEEVAHEQLVPHQPHHCRLESLHGLLQLVLISGRVRVQGLLLVPPRRVRVLYLIKNININ